MIKVAKELLFPLYFLGLNVDSVCSGTCYFDSVKNYYVNINFAELQIIDSNYCQAKLFYQKAFEYKHPNGKDLYHAFLVSFYTVDTSSTIKYLKALAFNGFEKEYFVDSLSNLNFYQYVIRKSNYDLVKIASFDFFDKNLIERINLLMIKDQAPRRNVRLGQEIDKVDLDNLNELLCIVKFYGWPTFEKTGFWLDGATPNITNLPFFLVLWHNRWTSNAFDNHAIDAVKKGSLSPDEWGAIVFGRNMFGKNVFEKYDYFMKIWDFMELDTARKKEINMTRKAVHLENLEDYYKKFLYQSKYNIRFGGDVKKSMFVFLNGFLVPPPDQIKLKGLYSN